MDPITRIAKDTGINDDDPTDTPADHGELIGLNEAERRFGVPQGTLSGWIADGRLTAHSEARRGTPRLVDADQVARLAAEPRRRGPRGPRKRSPAYLKPEFSGAQ